MITQYSHLPSAVAHTASTVQTAPLEHMDLLGDLAVTFLLMGAIAAVFVVLGLVTGLAEYIRDSGRYKR